MTNILCHHDDAFTQSSSENFSNLRLTTKLLRTLWYKWAVPC